MVVYRILQVGRDVADTGGGRVIIETSIHMRNLGHEIVVLSDVPVPESIGKGIPVLVTPLGARLKAWQPKIKLLRVVRHFLQMLFFSVFGTWKASALSKKGYVVVNHNLEVWTGDILVFHNVFHAEYANSEAAFFRKYVRWLNPVFVFRMLRERFMLLSSNRRVMSAVSAATRNEVVRFTHHRSDVRYINNGVNVDVFCPRHDERASGSTAGESPFILLFVGHEFERKGLSFLIKSLAFLPARARLLVLGGRGSSWAAYERLAIENGVVERIEFLGTITNTTPFYQKSDVFVLPASYEAWPLVGLEAMACGTPALMTPVGGITEYLVNGENGFFIKRDPKDIAEKVKTLMDDPELLQSMRSNARKTALKYSWDKVAEQYLDLIKEVAEEKARRA